MVERQLGRGPAETCSDTVVLFLYIPKTASTTLNYCIHDQWYYEDPQYPRIPDDYMFYSGMYWFATGFLKPPDLAIPEGARRALGREDLRTVLGHFWFGIHRDLRKPWTYATLLRDPLERVVSLYQHFRDHAVPRPLPSQDMSLQEFVEAAPFREVDNDQTRRISGIEPAVGACSRSTLDCAKDNLRRHFSVVGVTERFDETLLLMKRAFAWTKDLHYYRKNETARRPPTSALPRDTVDAIRDRNTLDLELYRFAEELLDERIAAQDPSFREELASFQSMQQARLEELSRPRTMRSSEARGIEEA
jgi:Sulfotransferase family